MSDTYKFVRAVVEDGELHWEYQIDELGAPQGSMGHDEDVSDYSEEEIVEITKQMLDLPSDQTVEVQYV